MERQKPTLRTLRIRDLVIVEDLTVAFASGLNLLTGETGAGKSILVDALGLVAGGRADRSLVRSGAERAVVEAVFETADDAGQAGWLRDAGIDGTDDGELSVRREVVASGTGRVWINGSPSTVTVLRRVCERLLELHGQHQQRDLLDAGRQLDLLDRFGGHETELRAVAARAGALRSCRERVREIEARAADRAARLESLRATVGAIDAVDPRPGEVNALASERVRLKNSGRILDLLRQVLSRTIDGDGRAVELADAAGRHAEELAAIDESLAEAAARLRAATIELEDAVFTFRDYRDAQHAEPGRLDAVESRLSAIEQLCLRLGVDEAELAVERERAAAEALALSDLDGAMATATGDVVEAEGRYRKAAERLSAARRRAAERLRLAVTEILPELALEKARFRIELPPAPTDAAERGAEGADFVLAPNPGEPFAPVRSAASGGELSRVMLALYAASERSGPPRIVVFDEIDAGVGGAQADALGAMLQRLASGCQVLCVTHLPQVAAYADAHFHVRKRVAAGRTHAGITDLENDARVEELARMLGGRAPSATSRRHASELLRAASRRTSRSGRSAS